MLSPSMFFPSPIISSFLPLPLSFLSLFLLFCLSLSHPLFIVLITSFLHIWVRRMMTLWEIFSLIRIFGESFSFSFLKQKFWRKKTSHSVTFFTLPSKSDSIAYFFPIHWDKLDRFINKTKKIINLKESSLMFIFLNFSDERTHCRLQLTLNH